MITFHIGGATMLQEVTCLWLYRRIIIINYTRSNRTVDFIDTIHVVAINYSSPKTNRQRNKKRANVLRYYRLYPCWFFRVLLNYSLVATGPFHSIQRFKIFLNVCFFHRVTCSCSGRSLRGNTFGSKIAQRQQSSQIESHLFRYMQSGYDRGELSAWEKRNLFETRGVSSDQQSTCSSFSFFFFFNFLYLQKYIFNVTLNFSFWYLISISILIIIIYYNQLV